jgi:hypothetical protein
LRIINFGLRNGYYVFSAEKVSLETDLCANYADGRLLISTYRECTCLYRGRWHRLREDDDQQYQ